MQLLQNMKKALRRTPKEWGCPPRDRHPTPQKSVKLRIQPDADSRKLGAAELTVMESHDEASNFD
ncbi:hypothetical protein DO97_08820 [Neosynechococcus sphagnicola sy1]|uniref:Uncharacterized protein n=1 Tax=Neosynechococcus sphagnicola sy1 TaxID=1497020 RepID=A0A098TNP6_9CYAN|nr:hypothetical protein DO97_08820 [Neosynechococcus sphagnicola sy1]